MTHAFHAQPLIVAYDDTTVPLLLSTTNDTSGYFRATGALATTWFNRPVASHRQWNCTPGKRP